MSQDAPRLWVRDTRLVISNAFARMPFRFGVVTLTAAPVSLLEVTVEMADGRIGKGFASDIPAFKWFDKDPDKTPADNVADLLRTLGHAREIYVDTPADTPFALWRDTRHEIERRALDDGFNRLGASFAASMMERAVIDATGRLSGQTFDEMVRKDTLGINCRNVFPVLEPCAHLSALPDRSLDKVALRHTIGLVDPLTAADAAQEDVPDDGFPTTLEDYLRVDGLRYLKVKVAGDLGNDIDRLEKIAAVMTAAGRPIAVTLDGNEQYKSLDDFVALMERIRSTSSLADFYESILFVEQPLDRAIALAETLPEPALAAIGKPLLIDEADGWTEAYAEAIELGYRGVSHKNCKGIYRSLLNAALAERQNQRARPGYYFQSAEDLTNLAVVPLQADLAVVATLGISHVERNGHHYFRGLDHLSSAERQQAVAENPDLYERHGDTVALKIEDGSLSLGSMQVPGLGVATPPNLDDKIAEADWHFSMLEEGGAV
ncbi:MAG: enolase C-terminal domain-like protein [Pseudomonadota bacterium]